MALAAGQPVARIGHEAAAKEPQGGAPPGMRFSIDGELQTNEPAVFTVEPHALRVIVGPEYTPEPPAAA